MRLGRQRHCELRSDITFLCLQVYLSGIKKRRINNRTV